MNYSCFTFLTVLLISNLFPSANFLPSSSLCLADEVKLPSKEKFYLFLLVGQSNMAGRGLVETQDKTPDPQVLMLNKAGFWVPAIDPLHSDKTSAGTGLGKTFALKIADANPGITIGLIPCAVGGSPIDSWKQGKFYAPTKSHPWDDAIQRSKIALKSGLLKGILWHQGESDSNKMLASTYELKLQNLIQNFRKDLGAPDVPFIIGQIGKFEDKPWDEFHTTIDKAHQNISKTIPITAYVSAEGLKHKGDKTHFDAASYREFGKRYAEAFLKLVPVKK